MATTEATISSASACGFATKSPAAPLLERLFGIDPRALATFRIAIATILLVDLVVRASDLRAMYADDGVLSIAATQAYQSPAVHWSLHFLNGSVEYQAALMVVAALLAGLLLAGYWTTLAT